MKKYVAPPWRIKVVEPIRMITREERKAKLADARYNLFSLASDDVYIDMLTDSGTGAMSQEQWSAMMLGDESYAGSRSFYRFQDSMKDISNYSYILPVHQGRGAEQVVLPILAKHPGMIFISNMHFDTTRAHVIMSGARPVDCATDECMDIDHAHPFKGNMNLDMLRENVKRQGAENVAGIIMTVTNNSAGGQPVSMENIRQVAELAKKWKIPMILDGARYAENAWFIKQREEGYKEKSVKEIAREMLSYGDVFLMSAKKDGLVNIGGVIAVKEDEDLYRLCQARMVPLEGFPTYGGLAGRDLEALAVGLQEALDEDYLEHRMDQVRYLGDKLLEAGISIQTPAGGHAIFVNCRSICPHIPFYQFPAQAVCNQLYLEGGIRAVEIGSFLLGRDPDTGENLESPFEWMRLCVPRRTYTYAHLDHVADSIIRVAEQGSELKGLDFDYEPEILRHFTASLKPVE